MTEEVKTETTDPVQETTEVAETPVVETAVDPVVETAAEENTAEVVTQTDPVDLGVQDASISEAQPAVNITAEMPQEADPVADGSLEKLMETVSTAAPVVVAAPVVEVAAAAPASTSDKSEEELYLDKVRESGTIEQKRMLAALETFVAQMKPRVEIEPSKGVIFQAEFLEHLLWLLKKDYEAFRGGWNVLLVYFSLYHGVNSARSYTALSEFSTTRFLFAWTKGVDKCNCYRNLITLLRATRNKDTRKHDIKTINLAFVGPNVIGEDELNNLKQFYGV